MKNPKVGDLVMVYDSSHGNGLGRVGKIIAVPEKGPYIIVRINGIDPVEDHVHRCQCVRLKSLKIRRTVWVSFDDKHGFATSVHKIRPKKCHHDDPTWCDESCYLPGWVEFREVMI